MTKPILEAENLTIGYNDTPVVENISFSATQGSVTAIIGPNGSGKTTLLKGLMGLLPPRSGRVCVFGEAPKAVRRRVGYVPQRFDFDRSIPITVMEFLHVSAPHVGASMVRERLTHLGAGGLEKALLHTLSGGQLQRVLIVRALLHDPAILYLDEPASGIDVGGEKTFYDLIAHVREEHKMTIVMVSHEIDVVYRFADQVVCINRTMVCHGAPMQALTPEALQKLYGGPTALYPHNKGHNHGHAS